MADEVIYESIEGKRGVRIESSDSESMQFLTMRNGFQWWGLPVDRDLLLRMHAAIESVLASSPSIEREVSGEASAEGVPGAALDPESWPSAALDEARAACVTPCDGGKNGS